MQWYHYLVLILPARRNESSALNTNWFVNIRKGLWKGTLPKFIKCLIVFWLVIIGGIHLLHSHFCVGWSWCRGWESQKYKRMRSGMERAFYKCECSYIKCLIKHSLNLFAMDSFSENFNFFYPFYFIDLHLMKEQ